VARLVPWLPFGRYRVLHALPRGHAPLRAPPNRAAAIDFVATCATRSPGRSVSPGSMSPRKPTAQGAAPAWDDVPRRGGELGYHTLVRRACPAFPGKVVTWSPTRGPLRPPLEPCRQRPLPRRRLAARRVGRVGTLLPAGYESRGQLWRLATRCARDALVAPARSTMSGRTRDRARRSVKMDIEGAEDAALRGLTASLRGQRVDRLCSSFNPDQLAEQEAASTGWSLSSRARLQGWRLTTPQPRPGRPPTPPTWTTRLVTALDSADDLDSWPHTLWTAPGWRGLSGSRRKGPAVRTRAPRGAFPC